jgi:hypothetical protein
MAVKQGLCRHVICFRTVYEAAAMSRPEEYPALRREHAEGIVAVDFAVLGVLGRVLDRAICDAPRPQVRDDARAAGPDRDQRIEERDAQSARPRDHQGGTDARQVHVEPDDHLAILPLRLRPLHRCRHRGDRIGRRCA